MTYSVSVVIPNYNGRQLLEKNLPFVYSSLKTSGVEDFEIIVPDDASSDASVDFLKAKYPTIIVIEHTKNLGFAGNINSGANIATKDLVLLLNSDVQLTDGYFIPLFKYFKHSDTFGVGGLIKGFDGVEQDQAKYPAYSYGNIVGTKNYLPEGTDDYTFFLSGANALVDREKFIAVGGFCEIFSPYYGEDLDLGLIAWRNGYRSFFEKKAICYHQTSSTINKEPSKKVRFVIKRNKIFLHYLHLEGIELSFFLTKTLLKAIFRLLTLNTVYFKAFIAFTKTRKTLDLIKEERFKQSDHKLLTLKEVNSFLLKEIDKVPV